MDAGTGTEMIGRSYVERGQPVTVVTRWGPGGGPRNVLIRRSDGRLVVRPFRGLRKPAGDREQARQMPDEVSSARHPARPRRPR